MGKVEHNRRTYRFMWKGTQYPYGADHPQCRHSASGLQLHRPRAAEPRNGAPRLPGVTTVEGLRAHLSGCMLNGSSLGRSVSSSSSSSSSESLSSPSLTTVAGIQRLEAHEAPGEKPLKRLAFVRSQGAYWLTLMSSAYFVGRAYIPLPNSLMSGIENRVSSAASQGQKKVLYALDAKVDSVISLAHTVAEEGEGWFAELAQRPPVKSAVAAYQRAHDTVVATPAYSKAMELGEGTLARVHDSAIYKSLLPLVGPFTEPAVKRLLDSPTFQAVKEHLAPIAPPAAMPDADPDSALLAA